MVVLLSAIGVLAAAGLLYRMVSADLGGSSSKRLPARARGLHRSRLSMSQRFLACSLGLALAPFPAYYLTGRGFPHLSGTRMFGFVVLTLIFVFCFAYLIALLMSLRGAKLGRLHRK